MAKNRKNGGHAASIPVGIMSAGMVSIAVTLLSAAITATLINKETIAPNGMEAASVIVTAVAAAAGALTAMLLIQKMRMQMCLAAGACYYFLLLAMTALFFGGQYAGLGIRALSILIGCGAVALLSITVRKSGNAPRRKHNYR